MVLDIELVDDAPMFCETVVLSTLEPGGIEIL
jgi:hypothetical protein